MFRKILYCLIILSFSLFIFGCQTSNQQPLVNAPMVNFYATSMDISPGEEVTLHWNVQNATQVVITPGIGEVTDLEGNMIVSPTETTEYTLTASNESGTSINSTTVTVN